MKPKRQDPSMHTRAHTEKVSKPMQDSKTNVL